MAEAPAASGQKGPHGHNAAPRKLISLQTEKIRFFVPGYEDDALAGEQAYQELRGAAERQMGRVAHQRRIRRVQCRLEGHDRTIDVGDVDAIEGQTVTAILQMGRDAVAIVCMGSAPDGRPSTVEITRRTVYDMTDFDG